MPNKCRQHFILCLSGTNAQYTCSHNCNHPIILKCQKWRVMFERDTATRYLCHLVTCKCSTLLYKYTPDWQETKNMYRKTATKMYSPKHCKSNSYGIKTKIKQYEKYQILRGNLDERFLFEGKSVTSVCEVDENSNVIESKQLLKLTVQCIIHRFQLSTSSSSSSSSSYTYFKKVENVYSRNVKLWSMVTLLLQNIELSGLCQECRDIVFHGTPTPGLAILGLQTPTLRLIVWHVIVYLRMTWEKL